MIILYKKEYIRLFVYKLTNKFRFYTLYSNISWRIKDMSEIVKHDQGLMRKSNKILILNLIREKRPISRAELAKITGMSPTSVSRIVSKLMEFGLIEETKLTSNGVGRKASLLDTNELSACSISIYLDLDSCIIGIVDFDGNLLKEERLTYDTENLIWTDIMNRVCETVKEMVKATAADHIKIVGLGVAVPGIVDTHRGVVVFSPQLGWTGVNLKKYLEEELGYRVVIENAIKAKALAEGIYGGAKDSSRAVYINFGSGVGSALITEDEIFRGTTNSAGEVGHTTMDPNGKLCDCGRRGCLQTYIADWALIQEAQMVKDVSTVGEIFEAYFSKEQWAVNIIKRLHTYIGVAICNVICMYNPDSVIIGGSLIQQDSNMEAIINKRVEELIWEPFSNTYQIKESKLGNKAGLLGMAELIFNDYIATEL